MSRERFVEVTCDNCANAEHFPLGDTDYWIRRMGGVVSKYGDFCSVECFEEFKRHRLDHNAPPDPFKAKESQEDKG